MCTCLLEDLQKYSGPGRKFRLSTVGVFVCQASQVQNQLETNKDVVPRETHEDEMEQMRREVQQCKEFIHAQQQLLQVSFCLFIRDKWFSRSVFEFCFILKKNLLLSDNCACFCLCSNNSTHHLTMRQRLFFMTATHWRRRSASKRNGGFSRNRRETLRGRERTSPRLLFAWGEKYSNLFM